jgi:DNA-binding NtrC family response regulator
MNLAFLHSRMGRFSDSLSTYSEISKAIDKHERRNILIFFEMSALPYALKGDIETARKTIAKCEPYLEKYVREKAIYFENLGLIEILAGNYGAAEKALKSGLEISLEIAPESALISQIKRLFGDLYVATCKFDLAERYAKEALVVAEKIGEQDEIAACYRIFARVEQHRGNENKAREWYKKAIDLYKRIGSQYELAVTHFLAATSGLYPDTDRTVFLYLARAYFESEEVRRYVEKIDALLRKVSPPHQKMRKLSDTDNGYPVVIAKSLEMKKLIAFAERAAESQMTVLLTGATGTGKDLLAEYIHYCSGRTGEFVSLNAAAIQDTIVESELFGSGKGGYTGSRDRAGIFERAHNGTFYLNEIADASPAFQAKLLEVLERKQVRRVGESNSRCINFRLIAASNQDLQQRIRDNLFRPDLYYRLAEIPIELPPLDSRGEDISALVEHFLAADFGYPDGHARHIEQLSKALSQRSWPGNVRQLRNVVRHLWLASDGDIRKMISLATKSDGSDSRYEKIISTLAEAGGNISEAARMLRIKRESTLRYWLKKFNINPRAYRCSQEMDPKRPDIAP